MKRVKRDVWITSDGKEWLDRPAAARYEQQLRLTEIVESFHFSGILAEDITEGLLAAVAAGKLQIIIPPTSGTTQR